MHVWVVWVIPLSVVVVVFPDQVSFVTAVPLLVLTNISLTCWCSWLYRYWQTTKRSGERWNFQSECFPPKRRESAKTCPKNVCDPGGTRSEWLGLAPSIKNILFLRVTSKKHKAYVSLTSVQQFFWIRNGSRLFFYNYCSRPKIDWICRFQWASMVPSPRSSTFLRTLMHFIIIFSGSHFGSANSPRCPEAQCLKRPFFECFLLPGWSECTNMCVSKCFHKFIYNPAKKI